MYEQGDGWKELAVTFIGMFLAISVMACMATMVIWSAWLPYILIGGTISMSVIALAVGKATAMVLEAKHHRELPPPQQPQIYVYPPLPRQEEVRYLPDRESHP